jgi:hypothetical protein
VAETCRKFQSIKSLSEEILSVIFFSLQWEVKIKTVYGCSLAAGRYMQRIPENMTKISAKILSAEIFCQRKFETCQINIKLMLKHIFLVRGQSKFETSNR